MEPATKEKDRGPPTTRIFIPSVLELKDETEEVSYQRKYIIMFIYKLL